MNAKKDKKSQILPASIGYSVLRGHVISTAIVLMSLMILMPIAHAGQLGGAGGSGPGDEMLVDDQAIDDAKHCASNAGAVPVYHRYTSGWGFMFHQNPFGNVYVTWYMTSEMGIGVDEWVFGAYVQNSGGPANYLSQGPNEKSGACRYVGNIHVGDFQYAVQGGGMGNQGSSSCTGETWWQTTITAEIGVTVEGPRGNVKGEFMFGGSESCTKTSEYDSEILIGETGDTDIPSLGDTETYLVTNPVAMI